MASTLPSAVHDARLFAPSGGAASPRVLLRRERVRAILT